VALRDLCLDRRKSRLAALTRLFTEKPNGEAVDKAVSAVAELPPVADCLDVEALSRPVRRPEEPALRARVEELERRADAIDASFLAGRNAEAVALAEPLLAEVKTVPYAPLRAEVELELGQLRSALGEYAKAHAWLRDAAVSAAEGHADGLEAKAWARLLFLVSENEQRVDEAAVIYELGAGPVARAHDALSEAAWLSSVGAYLGRKGSFEASKAAYRRVIDLREAALGLDHPQLGAAYHNMGALLNEEGEWAEAKLWYERALAVKERTLGPDHPSVALSLNNLGVALAFTGDEAGALALYDRALRIWEETLGKEHPKLAIVLCNLGEARRRSGDAAGAVPFFERALSIREKALGASHPDMASPLDGLGRARTQLGELDVAEPLLRRALALREKATGSAKQEIAVPLLALGELEIARGSPAKAVPLLERALELHNPKTAAELHTALAEALWAGTDRSSARAHMEAARDAFRRGGNARAAGKAEAWLAAHPTGRD
jgi:serine/threonine-protein kinase